MSAQGNPDRKRENFYVTPDIEADVEFLQAIMNAETKKDVYIWSVRMAAFLAAEAQRGNQFYLNKPFQTEFRRMPLPWIERSKPDWEFLVARPHSWRRQLYIKGTKIPASTVWLGTSTNKLSPEEAAENWDIPVNAVHEAIRYCEENKDLLRMEAAEERHLLESKGIIIDPPPAD